jgi:hypothetical protein
MTKHGIPGAKNRQGVSGFDIRHSFVPPRRIFDIGYFVPPRRIFDIRHYPELILNQLAAKPSQGDPDMQPTTQLNVYRVKVGHFQIVVQAATAEEAVAQARRQLALELPRFYDLIRGLDATRFEVRQAA